MDHDITLTEDEEAIAASADAKTPNTPAIDLKACAYNLLSPPSPIAAPQWNKDKSGVLNKGEAWLWSGDFPPPTIGTPVRINFNGLGNGSVESYFYEFGFLGVNVKLDKEPEWHRKQCKGKHIGHALVFGSELYCLAGGAK